MVQISILEPQTVDVEIITEPAVEINLEGELVRVGDYDEYNGPYSVEPKRIDQTLTTNDKHLSQNILVKQVPYAAVSNLAGGKTVIIG